LQGERVERVARTMKKKKTKKKTEKKTEKKEKKTKKTKEEEELMLMMKRGMKEVEPKGVLSLTQQSVERRLGNSVLQLPTRLAPMRTRYHIES
jgi:hypothetical protein